MDIKLCLILLTLSHSLMSITDTRLKEKYEDCQDDSQKSLRDIVEDLTD